MEITFGSIVGGINAAKSIAAYLGLIESLELKLDKLKYAQLDAALRTLKQAQSSLNEQQTLLREARACFNKAIGIEEGERLISSYIGLAVCHYQLGDIANAKNALVELSEIELNLLTPQERDFLELVPVVAIPSLLLIPVINLRKKKLLNLRIIQQQAKEYAQSL